MFWYNVHIGNIWYNVHIGHILEQCAHRSYFGTVCTMHIAHRLYFGTVCTKVIFWYSVHCAHRSYFRTMCTSVPVIFGTMCQYLIFLYNVYIGNILFGTVCTYSTYAIFWYNVRFRLIWLPGTMCRKVIFWFNVQQLSSLLDNSTKTLKLFLNPSLKVKGRYAFAFFLN